MPKQLLETLEELSSYFKSSIFAVGGAVRNYLMNLEITDIDLAAPICTEKVIKRLKGTQFKVRLINKKLFTLLITNGNYAFEFTSFRADNYNKGYHRPHYAERVDDIIIDAKRRDFTINAIYYDIKNKKLVDPLKGIEDIRNKELRAIGDPEKVFSEDGLRLMRLARIAAEIGFSIDGKTLASAKKYAHLIKDIVPERIREELNKITLADQKYGIKNAHVYGLLYLDKVKVLDYILPELIRCKGVQQRQDYHKYDVYTHIIKTYEKAPKTVRLAALFHDIGKPLCIHFDGSMTGHDIKGAELTKEIMGRFRYSQKEIETTAKLVRLHMYDLRCQAKTNTLRRFIQDNADIIKSLIALKKADHWASGKMDKKCDSATRLQTEFVNMKKERIPFSVKELQIKGEDLIELKVPKEERGIALNKLLALTVCGGEMLTREKQLQYIISNWTHKKST